MAKITMTIAGREFNLFTLYYQFQQDVDCKGRPESPHRNGLLRMEIESTDDTYLFEQFLTEELNTIPFSGKIESFLYRDEAAVRSLQWKEAYIIKMRESMEAYTNQPMITELILSPIDLVIDYTTYLTRHIEKTRGWWKLDPLPGIVPMQSPVYRKPESAAVIEEEEELDTEVSVIELTDPLEEDHYSAPGIYLQKSYKFKVNSYTTREPKPSEKINWHWGYNSQTKEGQTVYKELGSQVNGDTIHIQLNDKEAVGNNLQVHAYIHDWSAGGQTDVYIKPFYYYKGVKEWGEFQDDLGRENKRIPKEELESRLGDKKERARPYYNYEKAKSDYERALTIAIPTPEVRRQVIDNFYNGGGAKLSFGTDTEMSQKLKGHTGFQGYFNKYLNYLKELIEKKNIEETSNSQFGRDVNRINFTNWKEIRSYDYYGVMGGTQRVKVEIEVIQYGLHECKVKTKMYIQDWYGADWADIESDSGIKSIKYSGLHAFFMLQHYHYRCPFETEIIYESEDIINF